jgi:hypothetical protein
VHFTALEKTAPSLRDGMMKGEREKERTLLMNQKFKIFSLKSKEDEEEEDLSIFVLLLDRCFLGKGRCGIETTLIFRKIFFQRSNFFDCRRYKISQKIKTRSVYIFL